MDDRPNGLSLASIPKRNRIIWFVVAVVVVAAAAFGLGYFLRSPQSVAIDSSPTQIKVTASVEKRVVAPQTLIQGYVMAGSSVTINAATPPSANRSVVTATSRQVGSAVGDGTLLGAISGRPLIVLTLPVPLYRDLQPGDRGSDVAELQKALAAAGLTGVPTSEVVSSSTLWAVSRLYAKLGYPPPGGVAEATYVPMSEFVAIPGQSATVLTISAVGEVLTPSATFATLQTGSNEIVGRANLLASAKFHLNQSVIVQTSTGNSIPGTVAEIGQFTSPNSDKNVTTAGVDITVSLAAADASKLVVGDSASISTNTPHVESLAVPLIAIYQDNRGPYVIVDPGKGSPPPTGNSSSDRVYVRVTGQADGWAAIASNAKLPVGTKLVLQE